MTGYHSPIWSAEAVCRTKKWAVRKPGRKPIFFPQLSVLPDLPLSLLPRKLSDGPGQTLFLHRFLASRVRVLSRGKIRYLWPHRLKFCRKFKIWLFAWRKTIYLLALILIRRKPLFLLGTRKKRIPPLFYISRKDAEAQRKSAGNWPQSLSLRLCAFARFLG